MSIGTSSELGLGFFIYCYVLPNKRAGRETIMNSINVQGWKWPCRVEKFSKNGKHACTFIRHLRVMTYVWLTYLHYSCLEYSDLEHKINCCHCIFATLGSIKKYGMYPFHNDELSDNPWFCKSYFQFSLYNRLLAIANTRSLFYKQWLISNFSGD